MPKAHRKSVEEEENDVPIHGPINEAEAKQYTLALDDIVIKMGQDIKDEAQDAMKKAITTYKEEICKMVPGMDMSDADMVWHSIRDKVSLCICPQSEEIESQLEYIIPGEETPTAGEVLKKIEDADNLTNEDTTLIREVFDSLELVHTELASTCSALSRLSRSLHPKHLITVLKASIRPLIHIKLASILLEPDIPSTSHDLPDDPKERSEKLMIPDPESRLLRGERINSPTRILAAAWAFRVLNIYGKRTTQRKMQERYSVRVKQLATCITGRKYLGGMDRKRRLSGQDEGASTSKKAALE